MQKKLWQLRRKIPLMLASVGLFFLINTQVNAQAVMGARQIALGQATSALPQESWAVFSNPAMLSEEHRSVSFYGARYYGLSQVSDIAVSLDYPTQYGVMAAGVHRYGYDLFNKTRVRAGYKNSYSKFHFGVVLNYSHVQQGGGYGSGGALGIDLGVAAPITPNLWIGAKATNINQPSYGSLNDEKLERDLSVGLSYKLSDVALFTTDVKKDVQFPISYHGGVEVKIIDNLVGRAGVTTHPQTFSAGFGYSGSVISAHVAVQRHANQTLGYTPAVDFKVNW